MALMKSLPQLFATCLVGIVLTTALIAGSGIAYGNVWPEMVATPDLGVSDQDSGVELEAKYYFTKNLLALGSTLHRVNREGDGFRNATPLSNVAATAGLSYEALHGVTASPFNVFPGAIANNLAKQLLGMPDWKDAPGDTAFANRCRVICCMDFPLGKE